MEDFLRRVKLIDDFTIELLINKSDFVNMFKNSVDQADINAAFSGAFEAFSSSENKYKGIVNQREFEIRKRRRFFEQKHSIAKASGSYIQKGDILVINAKINAWNNFMYFFYGFGLLFYSIFLTAMFGGNGFSGFNGISSFFLIGFIIIHAFLMFGLPYFFMRKGVSKMKSELEREFHYIVSKINHSR